MEEQEIVSLIKQSKEDAQAMEQLLELFKPKVIAISRGYLLLGADNDDIVQEGMIGLFKAINIYDENKNHNFGSFATVCIQHTIQNAIKRAMRKKNSPLNSYLSIDEQEIDDEPVGFVIIDDESDIEQNIIDSEMKTIAIKRVKDLLSTEQFDILKMFLNGISYTEMARRTNKTNKDIDNTLQAIKKKLKTIKDEIR